MKEFKKLGIFCFGKIINVHTNNIKVFEHLSSLKRLFSLPITIKNHTETGPCLKIIEGYPTELVFEQSKRTLIFKIKWSHIDKSNTPAILLSQLLCLACIDDGEFIIHSSAISYKNEAYLFVGGLGSGKTTLSVALCKNSSFKWLSNDHLALSVKNRNVKLCQAHDFIDFRKLAFPLLVPYLSSKIVEMVQSRFFEDSNPWTKTDPPFSADQLLLSIGDYPCPIKAIFFPLLGITNYDFFQEMPAKHSAAILLQIIKFPLLGVETFISDNSGKVICPSIAIKPSNGWDETYKFVNLLTSSYPTYIVHGGLESSIKFITQKVLDLG